jgi:hypothetical protein
MTDIRGDDLDQTVDNGLRSAVLVVAVFCRRAISAAAKLCLCHEQEHTHEQHIREHSVHAVAAMRLITQNMLICQVKVRLCN